MKLKLESKWIERLARSPESGMGFQRVRVRLTSGRIIEQARVFNAEILEVADQAAGFDQADIADIEIDG